MASQVAAGKLIAGRYVLDRRITAGGVGSFWRARDQWTGRACALRVADASGQDLSKLAARYRAEADMIGRIRCEHVIDILDHGEHDGAPFLVMEQVDGEDLSVCLQRYRRLRPRVAHRLLAQTAQALARAHAAGIVHGDLTPEHILITSDGKQPMAKVFNFGLTEEVRETGVQLTKMGSFLRLPYYSSPEQLANQPIDWRSDLWSLGVIAYECLCGKRPFDSMALGELVGLITGGPIPQLKLPRTDTSPALQTWWEMASARDPTGRFPSAKAMSDALGRALGLPKVSVTAVDSERDQTGPTPAAEVARSSKRQRDMQGARQRDVDGQWSPAFDTTPPESGPRETPMRLEPGYDPRESQDGGRPHGVPRHRPQETSPHATPKTRVIGVRPIAREATPLGGLRVGAKPSPPAMGVRPIARQATPPVGLGVAAKALPPALGVHPMTREATPLGGLCVVTQPPAPAIDVHPAPVKTAPPGGPGTAKPSTAAADGHSASREPAVPGGLGAVAEELPLVLRMTPTARHATPLGGLRVVATESPAVDLRPSPPKATSPGDLAGVVKESTAAGGGHSATRDRTLLGGFGVEAKPTPATVDLRPMAIAEQATPPRGLRVVAPPVSDVPPPSEEATRPGVQAKESSAAVVAAGPIARQVTPRGGLRALGAGSWPAASKTLRIEDGLPPTSMRAHAHEAGLASDPSPWFKPQAVSTNQPADSAAFSADQARAELDSWSDLLEPDEPEPGLLIAQAKRTRALRVVVSMLVIGLSAFVALLVVPEAWTALRHTVAQTKAAASSPTEQDIAHETAAPRTVPAVDPGSAPDPKASVAPQVPTLATAAIDEPPILPPISPPAPREEPSLPTAVHSKAPGHRNNRAVKTKEPDATLGRSARAPTTPAAPPRETTKAAFPPVPLEPQPPPAVAPPAQTADKTVPEPAAPPPEPAEPDYGI
jgi:serine/threonine protein kinase